MSTPLASPPATDAAPDVPDAPPPFSATPTAAALRRGASSVLVGGVCAYIGWFAGLILLGWTIILLLPAMYGGAIWGLLWGLRRGWTVPLRDAIIMASGLLLGLALSSLLKAPLDNLLSWLIAFLPGFGMAVATGLILLVPFPKRRNIAIACAVLAALATGFSYMGHGAGKPAAHTEP